MKRLGWFLLLMVFTAGGLAIMPAHHHADPIPQKQDQVIPLPPTTPKTPTISVSTPNYLPYNQIITQLDQWAKEAPGLTERGSYGVTSKGQPIHYIRVTNLLDKTPKKVVMITGCIHGNESLATGEVMAWAGNFISKYGTDKEITELIDTRDVYFIPVVSPDSYPHSRHVDGVDPNRNFPCPRFPTTRSVPPIKSIQDFFLKIQPNAAISGHTSGRVFLTPYGDKNEACKNESDYQKIIGQMKSLSDYGMMRACQVYGRPIYGGEVDWYFRNGAFSIVCEFGTHQNIPTPQDIKTEFDRTYKSFLYFCQEGAKITVQPERVYTPLVRPLILDINNERFVDRKYVWSRCD